jgi:hypothetical protein
MAEVGLELWRNWWATAEFGKGSFYPHLPAAAQQDTVFLQDAASFLSALGLGGGDPLSQQGVRLIREQFRMGFQDAAGFLPGAGPDELLQGPGQGARGGLGVFAQEEGQQAPRQDGQALPEPLLPPGRAQGLAQAGQEGAGLRFVLLGAGPTGRGEQEAHLPAG